ncbi:transporter, YbiR family [Schinkia azotoformans MEV2011]|uniref:Transporter, YbiR family n=1 Tax=Schinkia azotoformans MEV2011 TaxID=1348973 RepID=A0A072NPR2_SCHAZ|nr:SLC13 family permease [Schinkia azotoformans]KEF39237.1 transporter, YbiR family [Schinkia azotoformans MEV2011]MEC1695902.1 SLC13 family permease [Schinkia azotoformans]MEC1726058.1 SLC13 family permease [Schinkia azotoformans]MEC1772079.1 SLC13 family permease [Schinkia azotoformans]MEC1781410.1 SLC13 family permease [Schinkia azotoformans]
MKESVLIQNKKKININFSFFIKDKVFTISLLLAIASCFIHPPKLEYVNIHVLVSLFSLMIAIKALDEHRVLDKVAISIVSRCNSSKSVSAILIFLCFFSSMFVTNDVALLTFVPLTLVISKRTSTPMMETIILLTIAANIGSSLTPMGNPQNLFIYAHYGLNPTTFFNTVFSIAVLGIVALYFLIDRLHGKQLKVDLAPIQVKNRKAAMIWGLVLAVIIMSIFGVISDQIAFAVTLVTVFLFNKKLLMKIDYSLLLTFICLFIFVGNISHTNAVQAVASASLKDSSSVYFSSILLSQLISNVPASILLAEFTTDWKPLLLGVNIGGLGTIIASMASVISYKLYIQVNPKETKKYLLTFSFYNFSFLAFFTFVQYFIL